MNKKEYSKEKIQMGARLLEIREGAEMSQEKLAEIMGISVNAYRKVERGENHISTDGLKKLHNNMGVSSDFILFGNTSSIEDIWKNILNSSEKDKLFLLLRLYCYFAKMRKGIFPLQQEQIEIDKLIEDLMDNI